MTKDQQIQALLLDIINTQDLDEGQIEILAIVVKLVLWIERGVVHWDPERQCLIKNATGERVATLH